MLSLQSSVSELPKFWAATFCPNPDFLSYERGNCHNSLLWSYVLSKILFYDTWSALVYSMPNSSAKSALKKNSSSLLKKVRKSKHTFCQHLEILLSFTVSMLLTSTVFTGKYLFEALLILQNTVRTCCVQKLFWMSVTISVG